MDELIYVIASKEEALLNNQCQQLIDQLLKPEQRLTSLLSTDGAEVSASVVLDELRTAPFLTEKRVVLVKDADEFIRKNRLLLEKYFDNPCPTGILILAVSTWPSKTKLAGKLLKIGKLISIKQPQAWQLPVRLSEYARQAHNKNLSRQASELLIELTGDSLPRLYSEIDKLALFAATPVRKTSQSAGQADEKNAITTQDVELLIGHNRLFNAFAVIDACLDSNPAEAIERLRSMFAEDKSAEYTVVGAFAFHFRRLFNAKVLLEKGINPAEVAKRLRIWGNKDNFFKQLRQMTLKQIGDNLQRLAAMDFAIKTGRTKADIATEQLVLNLAAGLKAC